MRSDLVFAAGMLGVAGIGTVCQFFGGCHTPPNGAASDAVQFVPTLRAIAQVGDALAVDAVARKDRPACWGAVGTASALRVAAAAIEADAAKELPAVNLDVSACLALEEVEALPDAARSVALVSSLLAPIVSLAATSQTCDVQAWATAVTVYVGAIGFGAADELAEPDGKIEIPAVPIGSCE
jgi:hypothetical protein